MFVRVDNERGRVDILTTKAVLSAREVHEALLQHLPEFRHTAHGVDVIKPSRFGETHLMRHVCYVWQRGTTTIHLPGEWTYEFRVTPREPLDTPLSVCQNEKS